MAISRWISTLVLSTVTLAASAQSASTSLHTRTLAATCASCHGTNGKAAEGSVVPPLAAMPKETMVATMKAFKAGTRPATIMHQLAKGYTDEQIELIATYFASIR